MIVKSSGESEPFEEEKLRRSLTNAGASPAAVAEVTATLQKELRPGVTTKQLYKRAYNLLKKTARPVAARYSLSRAVRGLGPHGYAFEKLVATLFEQEGYATQLNQTLPGLHVTHEVDVVAKKSDETILVECKHRLRAGAKCDIKIALYVYARSLDLKAAHEQERAGALHFDQFWLATSGDFTRDAIDYARGVDLHLVGWRYPADDGIKDRIERSGLHPLTCLTTIDRKHKVALLDQKIVFCRELLDNPELLHSIGVRHATRVEKEIRAVIERSPKKPGL